MKTYQIKLPLKNGSYEIDYFTNKEVCINAFNEQEKNNWIAQFKNEGYTNIEVKLIEFEVK